DRPAGPSGVEAVDGDAARQGAAGDGEGLVALDFAIGETAGGVEQPRRSRQDAEPSADRAEPRQLFLVGQGADRRAWKDRYDATGGGEGDRTRRRAALAAGLNVGLEPEQPVARTP